MEEEAGPGLGATVGRAEEEDGRSVWWGRAEGHMPSPGAGGRVTGCAWQVCPAVSWRPPARPSPAVLTEVLAGAGQLWLQRVWPRVSAPAPGVWPRGTGFREPRQAPLTLGKAWPWGRRVKSILFTEANREPRLTSAVMS